MINRLFSIVFVILVAGHSKAQELVKFQSGDGVTITADLYMSHAESAPFIVLFHQANWSRGEYNEIAPELNQKGYNCLAVDLRSGGSINNVNNVTKQNATRSMKSTQYADALTDMKAAVNFVSSNYETDKIIIWGSSYSSALAIKLAAQSKEVDAVLAFSPAEYFASQGKPRDYVTLDASNLEKPCFITSAKAEKNSWWGIYVAIPSSDKTYYLPESSGNHGSKALWSKFADSKGYWKAVDSFLNSI